ncbi:MAG: transcription antitermination factor NusB [Candidatus Eremiobacteraeota bacterium]|nr:transcription antitermination factor NusB [Candidatus Eremiobacteraeota bacterium]MBC5827210.1 transcription antitermination factor NusB [Candidatus Eremiobacteraeota bacterium]
MAHERREHRIALEILYAVDVGNASMSEALEQAKSGIGVFGRGDEAAAEDPYEPLYPAVDRRRDAPRATDWSVVEALVLGALEHRKDLESELAPLLRRWTLERLAGIDRLILILGAWEMRYRPHADAAAIINHAVELADRLSSPKSSRFVNGVLDAFAKVRPEMAN